MTAATIACLPAPAAAPPAPGVRAQARSGAAEDSPEFGTVLAAHRGATGDGPGRTRGDRDAASADGAGDTATTAAGQDATPAVPGSDATAASTAVADAGMPLAAAGLVPQGTSGAAVVGTGLGAPTAPGAGTVDEVGALGAATAPAAGAVAGASTAGTGVGRRLRALLGVRHGQPASAGAASGRVDPTGTRAETATRAASPSPTSGAGTAAVTVAAQSTVGQEPVGPALGFRAAVLRAGIRSAADAPAAGATAPATSPAPATVPSALPAASAASAGGAGLAAAPASSQNRPVEPSATGLRAAAPTAGSLGAPPDATSSSPSVTTAELPAGAQGALPQDLVAALVGTAPTGTTRRVVPGEATDPAAAVASASATAVGSPVRTEAPLGPSTTSAPAAVPFEAPHEQVYAAVSPLVRGEDGSYDVELHLRPRDLGAVQVNVTVHHGEVSISMNAADPAARDALRQGLSDLRQQLEGQGLRAGSMEVGAGGPDGREPGTHRPTDHLADPTGTADTGSSATEQRVLTPIPLGRTGLDLHM